MSDGYEGDVLAVAFRVAVRHAAARGVTKAAGGEFRRLVASYAAECLPVVDAVMRGLGDRLDSREAGIGALVAEREARMLARVQMPSQARPPEPRLMPVDLGETPLHAAFGPPVAGPHINGYGATAPEGAALCSSSRRRPGTVRTPRSSRRHRAR